MKNSMCLALIFTIGAFFAPSGKAQQISCPRLYKTHPMLTTLPSGSNCFQRNLNVFEYCYVTCQSGYEYVGPNIYVCAEDVNRGVGKWWTPVNFILPTCRHKAVDRERPDFTNNDKCVNGIVVQSYTIPGKSYGRITFDTNVTDNSGEPVAVTSSPPGYSLGITYNFEITNGQGVSFTATDKAGNRRTCHFMVSVRDKEPPKLLFCPANIEITTNYNRVQVHWTVPRFADNCGNYPQCNIRIFGSHVSGGFYQKGVTQVMYTAEDPSGNRNQQCSFTVKVKGKICPTIKAPINGMIVALASHKAAMPFCQNGFYPSVPMPMFYQCINNVWTRFPPDGKPFAVPDCIRRTPPAGQNIAMYQFQSYSGDCSTTAVQQEAINKMQIIGICPAGTCSKSNMKISCKNRTYP